MPNGRGDEAIIEKRDTSPIGTTLLILSALFIAVAIGIQFAWMNEYRVPNTSVYDGARAYRSRVLGEQQGIVQKLKQDGIIEEEAPGG